LRHTRDAFARCAPNSGHFGNAVRAVRRLQLRARRPQGPRHAGASGSFTKAEIAREDVLQSSEMIGHGPAGRKLKCRIPPASNAKKKQEFA
jgi:hypothetical protein